MIPEVSAAVWGGEVRRAEQVTRAPVWRWPTAYGWTAGVLILGGAIAGIAYLMVGAP